MRTVQFEQLPLTGVLNERARQTCGGCEQLHHESVGFGDIVDNLTLSYETTARCRNYRDCRHATVSC